LLMRLGYGITWKEGTVLVWGGLRGAVGLAMGLIAEHHEHVDSQTSAMIAFHVSGIVLLTLLVNGTTVDKVYNKLQVYSKNPFRMTYLRNVLCIVEDECRAEILERMTQNWFFEDVDFLSIVRCVPMFTSIRFDGAGIPQPEGVQSVPSVLHVLEAGAWALSLDCAREKKLRHQRSDSLSEADFMARMMASTTFNAHIRDKMVNVLNTGDRRLEFRSPYEGFCGLYVSARPASALTAEDAEEGSEPEEGDDMVVFSVTAISIENAEIYIGLLAGSEAHAESEGRERDVLGDAPNSIGLDLACGVIRYNLPATGSGEIPVSETVDEGDTVSVLLSREAGCRCCTFTLDDDGVSQVLGACPVGPMLPSDLYPAIQFQGGDELKRYNSMRSLVSVRSRGSSDKTMRRRALSMVSLTTKASAGGATVALSFELQAASLKESMTQLFHVVFNMVTHEYRNMHEQGLIGTEALAWLEESVGEAVDCTDQELNHARAKDYGRFQRMLIQTGRRVSNARRKSDELCKGAVSGSYLLLFEPIIVAYLALEGCSASDSCVDRFPQWGCLRRLGFSRTLSKMEALWAFVEAHKKVIQVSPALKRHKRLLECLRGVMSEAKQDLQFLRQTHPRLFFYGKHCLALRSLLTMKMGRLRKFVMAGWVCGEDFHGLEVSLWDQLHEVDSFTPSVAGRHWPPEAAKKRAWASELDVLPVAEASSEEQAQAKARLEAALAPDPSATGPEYCAWRRNFERLVRKGSTDCTLPPSSRKGSKRPSFSAVAAALIRRGSTVGKPDRKKSRALSVPVEMGAAVVKARQPPDALAVSDIAPSGEP